MVDHLFDIAELSGANIIEDQTARDVRWRMWAIDRATVGFNDGTNTFYSYEFFDLADRIYRWVAKLDDTAIMFEKTDPTAPTEEKADDHLFRGKGSYD